VRKVRWWSVAQSSRRFFFGGAARGEGGAGGGASGWRVTRGRSLALGAKTPWKVVRCALGGGVRATRRFTNAFPIARERPSADRGREPRQGCERSHASCSGDRRGPGDARVWFRQDTRPDVAPGAPRARGIDPVSTPPQTPAIFHITPVNAEEEQSRKRGEGSSAEAACRGAERSL